MFRVTPVTERLALLQLLTQPLDNAIVTPKRYFKASNELVVLTLLVTWTVTLAYDYRLAWDHPARNYVGHLNPCFGWDFPPASYIAVFACAADVYLAWTYATLEAIRTKLRDDDGRVDKAERFSLLTTYLHGFASMLWMVLWTVGPPNDEWTAHLAIFTTAVVFRYLCTLGNYVENRYGKAGESGRVLPKHTIYIVVYGCVTAMLPVLYFTDIIVYEAQGRTGVDPVIPWPVLQFFDIAWVVCLALSTRLSVPEPPILVTRRVLEFDEEFDARGFTSGQQQVMRQFGYTEVGQ